MKVSGIFISVTRCDGSFERPWQIWFVLTTLLASILLPITTILLPQHIFCFVTLFRFLPFKLFDTGGQETAGKHSFQPRTRYMSPHLPSSQYHGVGCLLASVISTPTILPLSSPSYLLYHTAECRAVRLIARGYASLTVLSPHCPTSQDHSFSAHFHYSNNIITSSSPIHPFLQWPLTTG